MIYCIELTPKAEAQLSSLPKNIQKRILEKLSFYELQEDPILCAQKLTGRKNTFRFRIGGYRAIFTKNKKGELIILLILKIGHRREIYD